MFYAVLCWLHDLCGCVFYAVACSGAPGRPGAPGRLVLRVVLEVLDVLPPSVGRLRLRGRHFRVRLAPVKLALQPLRLGFVGGAERGELEEPRVL